MTFLIGFVIWRLPTLLPRFAPRLARKLGVGAKASKFSQPFFARCMELLQNAGFRRAPSATPREFVRAAGNRLASGDAAPPDDLSNSLELLSTAYYEQRFAGASSQSPEIEQDIAAALNVVEQATAAKK